VSLLAGVIVTPLPQLPDAIAHAGISGFWIFRAMESILITDTAKANAAWLVLAIHTLAFLIAAGVLLFVRDSRGQMVYGKAVSQLLKRQAQRCYSGIEWRKSNVDENDPFAIRPSHWRERRRLQDYREARRHSSRSGGQAARRLRIPGGGAAGFREAAAARPQSIRCLLSARSGGVFHACHAGGDGRRPDPAAPVAVAGLQVLQPLYTAATISAGVSHSMG
jgi:hypothetical protein